MRIVHERDGTRRDLATNVDTADTLVEQARGLMFRESLPDDYALVFEFEPPAWPLSLAFDAVGYRGIHMVFVKIPLDVVWLRNGAVVEVKTLPPWRGGGLARADTVIELPAGAADGVEVGDEIDVHEDEDGK